MLKGLALTAGTVSHWMNNAKTKKDIKRIHQQAIEANYVNRAVFAPPSVDTLQLLLTTKEATDNDVYRYDSENENLGLNFIWGEDSSPQNTIVSGGTVQDRVSALMPFINKSQQQGLPVFVLHTNNKDLEQMVKDNSVVCECLSDRGFYYNPFRSLPADDMIYLLTETMDGEPKAENVLRALVDTIIHKEGAINIENLSNFPLASLIDELNTLQSAGEITPEEYASISSAYMAGSTEIDNVRSFLNKLNRQFESIFGRPQPNEANTKKILNQKGVVTVDVGIGNNDLVINLLIHHIKYLQLARKEFAILLDGLDLGKSPQLAELVYGQTYAISHSDFVSSLYENERTGDNLFTKLTGEVPIMVFFKHRSGTSAQKLSEHLGTYHKIRIKMNISQTSAFLVGNNNTRGVSVDEADEPRVRAESILKLPEGVACIDTTAGTLFSSL